MANRTPWIIGGVVAAGHVGLYLAFAANVGPREWVAAAMTAGAATAAAVVFSRAADVRFRFRARDVAQAWRMPWYVLVGTGQVLHALCLQLFTRAGAPSRLAAVAFDLGDTANLADAGRRALAVTYTAATPNFVVLGIVEEQRLLLFHQVAPGPVVTMTRNLGARP